MAGVLGKRLTIVDLSACSRDRYFSHSYLTNAEGLLRIVYYSHQSLRMSINMSGYQPFVILAAEAVSLPARITEHGLSSCGLPFSSTWSYSVTLPPPLVCPSLFLFTFHLITERDRYFSHSYLTNAEGLLRIVYYTHLQS